ncbi:hypothetical protein [Xanthomonas phage JGB6]|nr:hypothetical protein [Xanthomonas phage JGB6]
MRYGGVDYKVQDFDVETFIKFQEHFRAFGKAYNSEDIADLRKVVSETVEIVKLGIPEFPIEQIPRFNPLQMMSVVSMIAGLIPDADEETQGVIEEKRSSGGVTSIDFTFFVIEVMHFYHWDWEKIMKTPLKLFWTLLKTMYRLQAQEALRWVNILSMPNISEEVANPLLMSRLGHWVSFKHRKIAMLKVSINLNPCHDRR